MSRKPSPATVISLIALFVALGGTTYAAATIGSAQIKNNSIRSKDIRKGAVSTSDIKTGGVRSGDVKNGALRARDFRAGELPAGPQGPAGPLGPKGDAGTPGFSRALAYEQGSPPVDGTFEVVASRSLPAGSWVVLGTTTLQNTTGALQEAACELRVGGGMARATGTMTLGADDAAGDSTGVALTRAVTLTAPSNAELVCRVGGLPGNSGVARSAYLTAFQVGELDREEAA